MSPPLPIILLGNGGHARVVLDALRETGADVAAVVAPRPSEVDDFSRVLHIMDDEALCASHASDECLLLCGLGSVPGERSRRRREVCERFEEWGYGFAVLRHPAALVSQRSMLARGAQVLAGAVVQAGTRIGRHTIINTSATVDHDCIIGEHVHIATGATLCGGVTVGDGAFIGSGATVVQGIEIPAGLLVPAGTAVTRPVAPR